MTKKNNGSPNPVVLCKARTNLELDTILDLLNENDISNSYQRKGLAIGPYFESNDAKSYIEIYVFPDDLERARELIEPIIDTLE